MCCGSASTHTVRSTEQIHQSLINPSSIGHQTWRTTHTRPFGFDHSEFLILGTATHVALLCLAWPFQAQNQSNKPQNPILPAGLLRTSKMDRRICICHDLPMHRHRRTGKPRAAAGRALMPSREIKPASTSSATAKLFVRYCTTTSTGIRTELLSSQITRPTYWYKYGTRISRQRSAHAGFTLGLPAIRGLSGRTEQNKHSPILPQFIRLIVMHYYLLFICSSSDADLYTAYIYENLMVIGHRHHHIRDLPAYCGGL